ncbi:MAG: hypothetical protein AAF417_09185 [Pseudomonadota bacterium]
MTRSSRWLLLAPLLALGCSADSGLRPFTSDGCSLFPDSSLIGSADWCDCCFQHDIAYWQGGTAEERTLADEALRECVHAKTEDRRLADAMYQGVRVGGSPYFYNWYRWGYGWPFDRGYRSLTVDEKTGAKRLLDDYFAANPQTFCGRSDEQ